jgi:hypothetical protein
MNPYIHRQRLGRIDWLKYLHFDLHSLTQFMNCAFGLEIRLPLKGGFPYDHKFNQFNS